MLRARCRWIAIACVSCWALGPAVAIGLAAHELEHHGIELHGHSHATKSAEIALHGHLHEDDAGDHSHELTPASQRPSRLGQHGQVAQDAVTSAGFLSRAARAVEPLGRPPEAMALAPPDPFGLCVLRL